VTSRDDGDADVLARSLARFAEAADAAEALGLPTEQARAVHAEALSRLGFPSEVYVLALVGGTGVGKSSLLNAVAGSAVSAASALRPTTAHPVAWVPRTARTGLDGLLAWLAVTDIREHDRMSWRSVAILDLPDMDSLDAGHRAMVEQLLPKVDAVAWITDPEKYHDAILYDDFLRRWLGKLARQAIVINKVDRLSPDDAERVRRDVERDLSGRLTEQGAPKRPTVPVITISATTGGDGIREFSEWLGQGVDSKAVVRARVAATLVAHVQELARDAGVDPSAPDTPFLSAALRRQATDAVTAAVLRTVDLPGLERQAVAATRAQARRHGTGPMGRLTSLVYSLSGRKAQAADPDAFLVRWRDRGPLTPAVELLRVALAEPLRNAAPALRPALAAAVEPVQLRRNLDAAVDGAVARREDSPPWSRVWQVIGFLQTLATAAIALSAAWIVVWLIARPPVDTAVLPIVGRLPMPLVVLVAALFAGYVLARSLGTHAGWVGRRWAARLRREITTAVEREVVEHGLEQLGRLEVARRALWEATRDVVGGTKDERISS
jgi:GTP-binding protein EngB required for normal cell division